MRTLQGLAVAVGFTLIVGAISAKETRSVYLIAGPASHGPGEHEHPAGVKILADALNGSSLGIRAEHMVGWPEDDEALRSADAIVLYCDGGEKHVANGKAQFLRDAFARGTGLVALHYATEPTDADLVEAFAETLGGYFEAGWSVNPIWTLSEPALAEHPVTAGLEPFSMEDEWYYHLRFPGDSSKVTALLTAHPPINSLGQEGPRSGNPDVRAALQAGKPQALAWASEGDSGGRGFATTGGHYLYSWADNNFRKLALNGIVWSAGLDVPAEGVASTQPPLTKHAGIARAIASGDLEDIRRHVSLDPSVIDRDAGGSLTPLHQAVLRKKVDAALLLLELGADPSIATSKGVLPLHLTITRNLPEVSAELIRLGGDLSARDENGWPPLHLAGANDRIEIAKQLIDAGADPTWLSAGGGTALHESAASGSVEMAKLLLEAGIDPTLRSKTDVTALDIAREAKNEAVVEFLENL